MLVEVYLPYITSDNNGFVCSCFGRCVVICLTIKVSLPDRSIGSLWSRKIYLGDTKMGEEIIYEQKCSICVGNPYLCDEMVFWKNFEADRP